MNFIIYIYIYILLEIVMGSILAITIFHDYLPRIWRSTPQNNEGLFQSKQGSFGLDDSWGIFFSIWPGLLPLDPYSFRNFRQPGEFFSEFLESTWKDGDLGRTYRKKGTGRFDVEFLNHDNFKPSNMFNISNLSGLKMNTNSSRVFEIFLSLFRPCSQD